MKKFTYILLAFILVLAGLPSSVMAQVPERSRLVAPSSTSSSWFRAASDCTTGGFGFTSDTNTLICNPSADEVAIRTGGTNRLVVSSSAVTSTVPLTINTAGGVTLVDDAANTMAQRNGTATQEYRIGPAASYLILQKANGSSAFVGNVDATNLDFGNNNTVRWRINTGGHLVAFADNTYDIGASGATRPRDYHGAGNISIDGNINAGGNLRAGSAGAIYWNARSVLGSPANGQINLSNLADTAGIGLDFATDGVLKVRNRAQTAYADFYAGFYKINDLVTLGAVSDGVLIARNNAGTGFTRLILGTNDASGASLLPSLNLLEAKTGNGASFIGFNASIIKATDSFTSPLTTGTLVTNDAQTVVDAGIILLGTSAATGYLTVQTATNAETALYMLGGAGASTYEVHDVSGSFTVTKDTAASINIYYDAAGASGAGYYLQNLRGASRTIRLVRLGL